MRKAASLFRRNRFARLFAVSKCAELLLDDAFENEEGVIALRVESESTYLFDDLLEIRGPACAIHGWQIKQQSTPLDGDMLSGLLRALRDQEHLATGNIATSDAVPVTNAGHLRTLRDLCARLGAAGAIADDVVAATTEDERLWLQFAITATGSNVAAIATLSRLRVHFVGDERTLEDRARAFLPGLYRPPVRTVLEALDAYVSTVDGTIEIDAAQLHGRALAHLVSQAWTIPPANDRRHRRAAYLTAIMKRYAGRPALGSIPGAGPTPTALISQVYVSRRVRRWDSESRTLLDWIRLGTSQEGFLVVGEVGSGKSTLLQVTEAELAADALTDERSALPLLVNARDLKLPDPFASASLSLGLARDEVATLASDPLAKWIVLVDGADEVIGNTWTHVERLLGPLRKTEQLACLAVTTRPVVQPHHVPLDALTIEEWDAGSIDDFLQCWRRHEPDAVNALRSAPYYESLRERLLLNPLMATLCIAISGARRTVPASRAKVFVEVVELLFEGWRRTRINPPNITWHALKDVLAALAFNSLKSGLPILPTDLRNVIRTTRSTPVLDASDEVQRELGLLVARPDGSYDFVLRSFAEYLAAEYALATSADLDPLSREGWGEEIVRHAVGLLAIDDHGQADTRISELAGAEFAASAAPSRHLRPLLVALRTTIDLSGSELGCSARVAAAASAVLLDEDSAWIGKRVAAELRAHARTNSPIWQLVQASVLPRIDTQVPPARWQLANLDRNDEALCRLLRHRDPDIRSLALKELSDHFVNSNPWAIVRCIFDEGRAWGFSLPAPAIMAAIRLRAVTRSGAQGLQELLVRILSAGGQLLGGAAAVAILPGEADAGQLCRSLRDLARGYCIPLNVVTELADTPEGAAVIAREWATYRDEVRDCAAEAFRAEEGGSLPTFRPATAAVVAQFMICLEGALGSIPPESFARILQHRSESRDLVICRALLQGDFRPLETINVLSGLAPSAQRLLAQAAVRHGEVREALRELWKVIEKSAAYVLFPGNALEPLVLDGDAEALQTYCVWISKHGNGFVSAAPDSRVFEYAAVRAAAELAVRNLVEYIRDGRAEPSGQVVRLAVGGAAPTLADLRTVWQSDKALTDMLIGYVKEEDSNAYRGGLACLDGVRLDESDRRHVKQLVTEKIAQYRAGVYGRFRFEVLVAMRWLQRNGFQSDPDLITLLEELYETDARIAPAACALLLPRLSAVEARNRSAAVARAAVGLGREDLSDHELAALIAAAPESWCESLRALVGSTIPPQPATFVRVIEALPTAYRVEAAVSVFEVAEAWPLPWTNDEHNPIGRPADLAEMILFDSGIGPSHVLRE